MKASAPQTVVFKSEAGRQAILSRTDELLNLLPVAWQQVTIPTSYGDTWLLEAGDPALPAIMLLHGSTSNSVAWLGDIPELSRHFRVLAVDIIGDAGHSAPYRPNPASGDYTAWIGEVLDRLAVSRVTLMGVSFGGWLALKFAATHPERVERLVLLAASGLSPIKLSFLLYALVNVPRGAAGRARVARRIFGQDTLPAAVLDFTRLLGEHFNPMVESLDRLSDAALRRLTMPTLYIAGARDATIDSRKSARRLERLLPHGRAVVLPDRGHAVFNVPELVMPFLGCSPPAYSHF